MGTHGVAEQARRGGFPGPGFVGSQAGVYGASEGLAERLVPWLRIVDEGLPM